MATADIVVKIDEETLARILAAELDRRSKHRRPCMVPWPTLFNVDLEGQHRHACIHDEDGYAGTGWLEHRCDCGATFTAQPGRAADA